MAFTVTVDSQVTVFGNKRRKTGSYVNDSGSTGGDITTGLALVEAFRITPTGAAVQANAPVVNETLPLAGGVVTIVTDANTTGYWEAIGI